MVSNVVLKSLISGYLYLSFPSLHFSCLFQSQSFKKSTQPCSKCYSLSVGIVVSVGFITKGCGWRTTPMWREQTEIRWARHGIFIVAWFYGRKLCALAARPFQSEQSGALTKMWRCCQVQPSQKEHKIGAVHYKNEGMFLQTLGWRCIESVVFACPIHENDQRCTCTWISTLRHFNIDVFGCYHFCL